MEKLLTLCAALAATAIAIAQPRLTVTGLVADAQNNSPVGYATVSILSDSTVINAAAADADGRFTIQLPQQGIYRIRATMVGYNACTKELRVEGNRTDAGTLLLTQGVDIDDVVVAIQKPLVTSDAEKLNYSVEDDPEAATSTLEEIIRKVPQLAVDAEGNVTLNGQSNYKVLLNGHASAMFNNFKEVIRSMPASQIKRIEVITNPSMKYDAEGTGGIINIITVRKQIAGYNGSLNSGVNVLRGTSFYGGGSFSLQTGKFAFSLQPHYFTSDPGSSSSNINSFFQENFASADQHYRSQEGTNSFKGNNLGIGLDLSYQPDTLNLLTLETYLWNGNWKNNTEMRNVYSDTNFDPTHIFQNDIRSRNPYTGGSIGLNYEHNFGKEDHTLTISDMIELDGDKSESFNAYVPELDYDAFRNTSLTDERTTGNTFQIDYTNPFDRIHSLEAGAKYIYRNSRLDEDVSRFDADDALQSADRSDLTQRQQILALYAGYGLTLRKISARAGARMERTWNHSSVDSSQEGSYSYDNSFFNAVPYLSLNWKVRDNHNLSLSYTERLQRPIVSMLSPYVNDSDPNNVLTGNPDLEAAVSHNLALKYNFFSPKWSVSAELSEQLSNNSISRYSYVDDQGITYNTYSNDVRSRTLGFMGSLSYRPSAKFMLSFSMQGQYADYELPSQGIETRKYAFFERLNINLTPWKHGLLAFGEFYTSGQAQLGTESNSQFFCYFQIGHKFFNEKMQLSLNAQHPFSKYLTIEQEARTPSYTSRSTYRILVRSIGFRLSYRFGKQNVGVKRTRRSIENDDRMAGGEKGGSQGGLQ